MLEGWRGRRCIPLALGKVRALRSMCDGDGVLTAIQIIGGVSDAAGFRRMKAVGASAVEIGTALGRKRCEGCWRRFRMELERLETGFVVGHRMSGIYDVFNSYRLFFVSMLRELQEGRLVVVHPETPTRSIVSCLWSLLCFGRSPPIACHLPPLRRPSVPVEAGPKAS